MKKLSWSNIVVFGRKNQTVVAVMKRFERGPIKSRVRAFSDVFSMTNFRLKSAEGRSEPSVAFRLATGEFGAYFVK